ncbi:Cytochrome c oxidase subunit 5B, mitochondrial [Malassezia psittaci]|uniref:Cytochrome c oxidase subunit 5B, mitochondrial n=1 Tax=Malassezia psittaci TaxID=1821823 RepID=A0AAF0FDE5_9BASI|nr:Cytochrome c oxidase subunit 5B, mitochondrial [Malassezia psittaci]
MVRLSIVNLHFPFGSVIVRADRQARPKSLLRNTKREAILMIASVRVMVPRVVPRNAGVAARTIVTKSERWTPAVVREGKLLEQNGGVQLSEVLPNIESHWTKLSHEQQYSVYKQLEEIQRKDWHDLTLNEQKGAYFVAYGPYGPRKVVSPPGSLGKVILGTVLSVGAGVGLFALMRSRGTLFFADRLAPAAPKTMTPEYKEQENQRAKELGINPIYGVASENYKGKGFAA